MAIIKLDRPMQTTAAAAPELEDSVVYEKALQKLTAALREPMAVGFLHLSTRILTRLKPSIARSTVTPYTFQWIHLVNPLSNIQALYAAIRGELENLFGPNWNDDSRVGHWMMDIIYTTIDYLTKEGKAWEAYRGSRLKTRASCHELGDDDVCSICLELLYQEDEINDIAVLDCRHKYHVQCINEWLLRRNLCPLCRATGQEIDVEEFLEIISCNDEWIDGDMESLLENC